MADSNLKLITSQQENHVIPDQLNYEKAGKGIHVMEGVGQIPMDGVYKNV